MAYDHTKETCMRSKRDVYVVKKEMCMCSKRPIHMYDQRVYNQWVGRREGYIIYI